jgi:trehalose 2-sulfotransferase
MSTLTELWNRKLMSFQRDVSVNGQPKQRYTILSVPRSGSTLLARGMEATGILGVPLEYLNQNAIDAWHNLNADFDEGLIGYLSEIEKRRTSESGWFGLKAHYRHFENLFGELAFEEAVKFVEKQDYCILTTRRNKVAQSVSYFRARESGIWSSEHQELIKPETLSENVFSPKELLQCLDVITNGEQQWRKVLECTQTNSLEVVFEDLVDNYFDEMQRVFDFLKLKEIEIPIQQLQPVRRSKHDNLESQFRDYLINANYAIDNT